MIINKMRNQIKRNLLAAKKYDFISLSETTSKIIYLRPKIILIPLKIETVITYALIFVKFVCQRNLYSKYYLHPI